MPLKATLPWARGVCALCKYLCRQRRLFVVLCGNGEAHPCGIVSYVPAQRTSNLSCQRPAPLPWDFTSLLGIHSVKAVVQYACRRCCLSKIKILFPAVLRVSCVYVTPREQECGSPGGTPIPDGVPLKLFASVADMVHERVGWKKPRIPGKAEQEVCPVLCPLLQMDAGAEACLYNDEPAHDVHLHRKRMHAICL